MIEPGSVIAERFEIVSETGSGGMGRVFRARDRLASAWVGMKAARVTGEGAREAFLREANVLADLDDPAIVRYVAHGITVGGDCWLAMQWIEGMDLRERLARGPLAIDETLALGRRLARGLAAAHARGVVHRDVKPRNILLPSGRVDEAKLADFGLAQLERTMPTDGYAVAGTLGYMAPEQARGDTDVGAPADVFALGCVLYECLAGRPAFPARDRQAVLARVLLDEPEPVRVVAPHTPRALAALVGRMLAKAADERPQDGAGVLAEIDALGAPGAATTPSLPAQIGEREQRLVCVVAGGGRTGAAREPEATLPMPGHEERARVERLRRLAEGHGARLERLADGSVIATLLGRDTPTDQAGRALRLALRLCGLGGAPLAVATGRGDRSQRLPLGEVIDRALGLLGDPGVVRVDENTAALLRGRFNLAARDGAWEIRGEREKSDDAGLLLGRPTPFVGRDRELGVLLQAFEEAAGGSVARAVLVTGPAGVGKSRLWREFALRIRGRAEVAAAHGDCLRAGAPFGMLAPALRRICGVSDDEPPEAARAKVRARVESSAPSSEAARAAEFLGELMGVPFPDAESLELRAARQDARLMGDQMRRAFESFILCECARAPLVLALGDLQWGDLPTVRLVDAALRVAREMPFFVVALGRPEVHALFPNLWGERPLTEMRLGDLTRRAAERLVRETLGEAYPPTRVAALVERAGGNAFVLEEMIRAEVEGRSEAPLTAIAMLDARLAGLSAAERRVLRAASVFGRRFWAAGVEALVGAEPQTVSRTLDALAARDLVVRRGETRFRSEDEYAFAHDLVREAAYAMLGEDDRKAGHRLAVQWLEVAGESDASVLAEHFERAGDPRRASGFHLQAAWQALEGGDSATAAARAERGLACGAEGEVRGALKAAQAEAALWSGRLDEAERTGMEAMDLLRAGSLRWCLAARRVCAASFRLGNIDRVEALGRALRSVVADAEAEAARLAALALMAGELFLAGRRRPADDLLREIEAAPPAILEAPGVAGVLHAGRGARAAGDVDTCTYIREMESATRAFERAGDRRAAIAARCNLAHGRIRMGLHVEAEAELRALVAEAMRLDVAPAVTLARNNLGLTLARQNRLDEAREIESAAADAARAEGNRRIEGASRIYLAGILMAEGDLDGAEREARAAVELLRGTGPMLALALATLARVDLNRGRVAAALDAATEAHGAVARGGAEEGEAAVRLAYAEALMAAGRAETARQVIAEARARLLERAAKIDRPDWRRSFLDDVPENARTLALARAWVGGEE